jgi:hypothetical protein
VSLRSDIHAAYDELATTPELFADRVLRSAAAPERRTAPRWRVTMRPPLALVAALLVVAIVVGALVGGRLVRDWNNFVHPSVPGGQSSVFQKQLHVLESRALNVKTIAVDAPCQTGPYNGSTGWWGGGPVYLSSPRTTQGVGGLTVTASGLYVEFDVMTDAIATGPVLVRAMGMRTGRAVVFVGNYVAGPQVGVDLVNGVSSPQHAELALDPSSPPKVRNAGYVVWPVQAGIYLTADARKLIGAPAGAGQPFCIGWQVDGAGFSENFTIAI